MIKGIALDPKPFFGKCSAPVFLGVGGCLGKFNSVSVGVRGVSPFKPASGPAVGHEDLPARFKDLQLGHPACGGLGGTPGVNRFYGVVPANDAMGSRVPKLALVERICGSIAFFDGAMTALAVA